MKRLLAKVRAQIEKVKALRAEVRDVLAFVKLRRKIDLLKMENRYFDSRLELADKALQERREAFHTLRVEAYRDLQALTAIKSYVTGTPEGEISKKALIRMFER
jgi:hypothetical protein